MPKEFLKKYMPDAEKLKAHKSLQFLGARLHEPNLWHLNRRSVALAFAVGLFCAWIPTPGQMAIAAVVALYFRANLPISVGLVWLTNPISMPPLFYFSYRVGLWIMDRPSPADDFQFSLEGVFNGLGDIWEPFLLGCLIVGIICSAAGYFGIHYVWRKNVAHKWRRRQQIRAGISVPDAVHPIQQVCAVLQDWLSAHPEINQKLSPMINACQTAIPPLMARILAVTETSLTQGKRLLGASIKRIQDFVPFG
ncbi:MAG: DUF2062 domain-containing protein [Methylococcales bacterium]|nr:DUF2062 domain-containing protein [Methylococcales bacterium]